MRLRVVCGLRVTMASLAPTSAFSRVDLPALGRPRMVTNPERRAMLAIMETLFKYDTTNARSLDSAELPKKRQFCFARDDRDELNQGFPITNYRFSRLSAAPDRSLPLLSDRKSTRLNSSHPSISYAVFCLK